MLLQRLLRARAHRAGAASLRLVFSGCDESCGTSSSSSSRPAGQAKCDRDVTASGTGPRGWGPGSCLTNEGTSASDDLWAVGFIHSRSSAACQVGGRLTARSGCVATGSYRRCRRPRWTNEAVSSFVQRAHDCCAPLSDPYQEDEGGGGGGLGEDSNGGQELQHEEDMRHEDCRRFGVSACLSLCGNVDGLDDDRGGCRRSRFRATSKVGRRNARNPRRRKEAPPRITAGIRITSAVAIKVRGYVCECSGQCGGGWREGRRTGEGREGRGRGRVRGTTSRQGLQDTSRTLRRCALSTDHTHSVHDHAPCICTLLHWRSRPPSRPVLVAERVTRCTGRFAMRIPVLGVSSCHRSVVHRNNGPHGGMGNGGTGWADSEGPLGLADHRARHHGPGATGTWRDEEGNQERHDVDVISDHRTPCVIHAQPLRLIRSHCINSLSPHEPRSHLTRTNSTSDSSSVMGSLGATGRSPRRARDAYYTALRNVAEHDGESKLTEDFGWKEEYGDDEAQAAAYVLSDGNGDDVRDGCCGELGGCDRRRMRCGRRQARRRPSAGVVRYGEARHPGPEVRDHVLPLRPRPGGGALSYPETNRDGFRCARTAGFERSVRCEEKAKGQFALKLETSNTTGWKGLKRRLQRTSAHVLFAQETRAVASEMAARSNWAARRGWKSMWNPATRGKHGGPSAGVAVFVRDCLGMRPPPSGGHLVGEGRGIVCVVDAPGYRPFLAASIYGHSGKGPTAENADLLRAVGIRVQCQGEGWQYVIAGDYNMTPAQVVDLGFVEQLNGTVVKAECARGTCRTATSARTIDFYVMSDGMTMAVEATDVIEGAGIKTHVPVTVDMVPRAAAMKALYVRPPPRLPRERVYGPLPTPMDWSAAAAAAEKAVDLARSGARDQAEACLEEAYRVWADTAEQELMDVTGADIPKTGLRGLRPNVVWRSILPERAPQEKHPRTAVAMALHGMGQELDRILRSACRRNRRDGDGDDGDVTVQTVEGHEMEDDEELGLEEDDVHDHVPDASDGDLIMDILATVIEMADPNMHPAELTDLEGQARALAEDAKEFVDAAALGCARQAADLDARVKSFRKRAWDIQEAYRKEEEALAKKEWESWLAEGFDKGAKNAHRFSKEPEAWVPTETRCTEEHPIVTSDPIALQDEQRRKYASRWRSADAPQRYEWEDRVALPRLSADEVRQASLGHKLTTAETFDGVHPRHFALLDDAGLAAAAALLEASELLGDMPRQLQLATMPLIGKPKGGFRGIGVLPGLYRVWGRARRKEAEEWERRHKRSYFSASEGNGAVDTVWRQAAKQEAGVAEGKEAAGLIYDLEAFYELIDRGLLVSRASESGFPTAVLRLCLGMYSAPRVLSMRGRASRELHPRRGIIAGCPMATTLVKVFCVKPLDALVRELPASTHVDAHIDDFVITGVERERALVADMKEAEILLRRMLNKDLGGNIAMDKAGLVASKKHITIALRDAIPGMGDAQVSEVVNLGADFGAGRRRKAFKRTSKLGKRLRTARARRSRLATITRVIGRRGMRIYSTGLGPAGAFGGAVHGFDDDDILMMRRTAAAGMPPQGTGQIPRLGTCPAWDADCTPRGRPDTPARADGVEGAI